MILKNKLEKVRVDIVIDGDTAMLKFPDVDKHKKARFIGVNSPEDPSRKDPFGKESTDFAKKQILKKYVYIERDKKKKDKHGRHYERE